MGEEKAKREKKGVKGETMKTQIKVSAEALIQSIRLEERRKVAQEVGKVVTNLFQTLNQLEDALRVAPQAEPAPRARKKRMPTVASEEDRLKVVGWLVTYEPLTVKAISKSSKLGPRTVMAACRDLVRQGKAVDMGKKGLALAQPCEIADVVAHGDHTKG